MFEWTVRGVRCRLSILFPMLLAALLFFQPSGMAATCVVASAMHECGHLLAMLLLDCPPSCCTLGAFGMRIEMGETRTVGYGRNVVISLAGPAVNLVCAVAFWMCGRRTVAAVHLIQCAFNLLPAAALDGGQIWRCVCCRCWGERVADGVVLALSIAVLIPLATAAVYLVLTGGNVSLLIVVGYLALLVFWHPQ